MGIANFLKSGKIRLNVLDEKIEIIESQDFIFYDSLSASDWGYVYEKHVGQVLEEEGWEVDYRGLKEGFLDGGIDLMAYKGGVVNSIQCKYLTSVITKSTIEWLLYKASRLLDVTSLKYPKKTLFTLVVSDVERSFSKNKRQNFNLRFSDTSKVDYPLLQYFLDHNQVQDKVKLNFREIKMIK